MSRLMIVAAILISAMPSWAQNCGVRDPMLRGTYFGECVRGWANGQGRAQGRDRYEGVFMDGQAHGRGTYTFADGTWFEGEFVAGQVQGKARFHYADASVLDGEFRDGRLAGIGRLTQPSGAIVLVELRGAVLVPAAVTAAVPTSPSALPAGVAPGIPQAAGGPPDGWTAQLDFGDLFPSFILQTATRSDVSTAAGRAFRLTRSAATQGSRALSLSGDDAAPRFVTAMPDRKYLGDPWGLIGITFRNSKRGTKVVVQVAADVIAEPTQATFTLDEEGEYALYPRLRYRFDRLRDTVQPAPVSVAWSVWVDGEPRGSVTRATRLRSVNDVPFMLQTPNGSEPMTWTLAGFVTEDAPWVPELLREAFASYRMGPLGYQGGPEAVDAQVRIVYELLKRRGFKYSSITGTAGSRERVWSQFVRFPSESIRSAEANCADGTVLMATLLQRAGIKTLLVTGPGHALLGYVLDPSKDTTMSNVRFVETTMVGDEPFEKALDAGYSRVQSWRQTAANDPRFTVVSVNDYRARGVMPIAR